LNSQQQTAARKNAPSLLEVVDPSYQRAAHIELLNTYLEKAANREIKRLMIFMPPQHGKSTTVSKGFASWWIGTYPDEPVILASYGQDWAEHWGRECRGLLTEYGDELWGVKVRADTHAAKRWQLEWSDPERRPPPKGGMTAVGIGGATTGRGAGLFLIDDPVKDQEEARSAVIQQRNIDWYQTVVKTRLAQDGVIVVIQTRWHENDLSGWLLRTEGHAWTVLSLPALTEIDDPLDREPGAALWPEKYRKEYLEEIRHGAVDPETGERRGGTTSYWFNAMYQQRPTEEEGGTFKRWWWQWYDQLPGKPSVAYITVDTAGYDTKTTNDRAVLQAACKIGPNIYTLEVQKGWWEFPELLQRAISMQAAWEAELGCTVSLIVEEVPWSKPVIQTLREKAHSVIPFSPMGHSKESRADSVTPYVEGGNWYLKRGAAWADDFVEEHAAFPNGTHDDQVDTTSMMGLRIQGGLRMPQSLGRPIILRPTTRVGF
jgi:predicted phage terminase large subunit-like protein